MVNSFRVPSFNQPLDCAPYLARVPADATCKGMFFHDIINAVERKSAEAAQALKPYLPRRYMSFKDYPLREHMEVTAKAAELLYPDVPSQEGMRRLGWLAYPTFAESMVGKVIFGILGNDLDRIFKVAPKSLEIALSRGRVHTEKMGDRHWRFDFRDAYGYLDIYYVGVIEGPVRYMGFTPKVLVSVNGPAAAVMDVTWS